MNNKIKQRFINYWNSRSGVDYSKIPFTIEMLENGDLSWNLVSSKNITSLQYQVNNDTPVDVSLVSGSQTVSISNLTSGDKVKFKGVANKYVSSDYQNTSITSAGYFKVYGNVMSLYYDDDFSDKTEYPTTTAYNLNGLFYESTKLIDAENLILPALRLYGRTYREFFRNCTSLTKAPKVLPATIIDNHDYMSMFMGCTSLTTTPVILATQSLGPNNMREMFCNCTSLVTPPIISINTDKKGTCQSMFKDCTSLTTAPELPQMIVGEDAYREMFSGCTSLATAPELPATRIASCSYSYMFYGCTSLTSMPDILFTSYASTGDPGLCAYMFYDCRNLTTLKPLKLTTYPRGALQHMFDHCTSLVDASIFDMSNFTATESDGEGAFDSLFRDCASLIIPPKLPTFQHCPRMGFREMFSGCTSLTTAPEIKATSYGYGALYRMFAGCTSLTTAPVLYATTLSTNDFGFGCCKEMFDGCKNINYIKSFATSQPVKETTFNWLRGVSNTGTIDCMYPLVFDLNSPNGIPTGWNINYLNTNEPLKFVNKGNTTATIGWYTKTDDPKTIKYSTDNENWTSISSTGDMATLAQNEVLYIKATNSSYGHGNALMCSHFTMSGGEISVEGNIMSLIDEDNFSSLDTLTTSSTFSYLFKDCTSLKYADKLQLLPTTLTEYCYLGMFSGCTSLTTAPALIATTLANNCYNRMFSGCTSLITAPALPATTLASYCYTAMFHGCKSLTTAPELPATALADYCYHLMFNNCTSLTTAPALPATTLAKECYSDMFNGCTSLTTAPELPATTLANSCYQLMFYGCTALTTAPALPATVLTAYCYYNMFNGCSNINKIYMLATDISATDCLVDWLKNTASTGKIYYDVNSITLQVDSDSGIPVGWTGIDIYSLPENKYFTLEALEDGTITYKSAVGLCPTHSKNNEEWERSEGNLININVKAGDVIRFKQIKDRLSTGEQDYNNTRISSTGKYKVYGNIMSLLYGDNFYSKTTFPNPSAKNYCFRGLFKNSTTLIDISNLIIPLTETADFMMAAMFENCSSITTPCKLPPVKTLSNRYEYQAMFYNCTALTTNPDLIATTGSPECYERMFCGCTSLSSKPIIKLNTVSFYSCAEMFSNCTNINYVEIWTTYNTYSFSSWLYNTAASGYIVYLTSNYIEKPSGWKFINMIYSNNDTDYYASKDYAAHVLGYESPQDAIDAGYTLESVLNSDNNWTYYRYTIA